MQPNKAATPWGAASTVVTIMTVLAAGWVTIGLIALIPGGLTSFSPEVDGYVCTTVTMDEDGLDEDAFGAPGPDGVLTTATRQVVCTPNDDLAHPTLTRTVANAPALPLGLAALGLALAARRVISRTRDEGPFSQAAVRVLRPLRWWAPAAVFVAVNLHGVLQGIANDLVADASWPDVDFVPPTAITFLTVVAVAAVCEFGARQRQDAYEHGRGDSGPSGPIA